MQILWLAGFIRRGNQRRTFLGTGKAVRKADAQRTDTDILVQEAVAGVEGDLYLAKKKKDNPKEIVIERTPGWERTNDVQGHSPKFPIHCFRCSDQGKTMPMALRHSTVYLEDADEPSDCGINHMAYKCPRCAWFITFHVVDEGEYLKRVLEDFRHGNQKLVPECDNWSDEHEEIGRQLQALGYWGGN